MSKLPLDTELSAEQMRVKKAIEYLQHYINTYDNQFGYLNYTDNTIIDDILYGLGVALDDKEHPFAKGYTKFKVKLLKKLQNDPNVKRALDISEYFDSKNPPNES